MEVYFMGVRLFSKKLCNLWPNNRLVASKCVSAFDDVLNGGSAQNWEHIKAVKIPEHERALSIGDDPQMYRTAGHSRARSMGGHHGTFMSTGSFNQGP